MSSFNNRAYGCAIIKSVNSNYNADFSGQPRKLPNGKVYATDKALKYSIRYYWKRVLDEKLMYFKRLDEKMIPYDLVDLYEDVFKSTLNDDSKADVLKNLLTCIDVRLFGATFAPKTSGDSKNISLHGTCQITPGVNKFTEDVIYTEQILSQLRNPEKGKQNTTIGTQSRLEEGHYVHHFSVNPKNIEEDVERVEGKGLTQEDIDKLKEGLRRGASFYDSSAKAGTENELLLWVQLKEDSRIVLPSFVDLVDVNEDKTIDFKKVDELLSQDHIRDEIEKVEIYYSDVHTKVVNEPEIAEKQQL